MNRMVFKVSFTFVMLICLGMVGCNNGPADQPDLGQVEGTITFEGQPLAGASVVYHPVSGRPAVGKTDDKGHYTLNYIRKTKGCKTGFNKVEIAAVGEGAGEEVDNSGDDSTAPKPKVKPSTEIVPARYNTKTELEVEVKKGPNTFDFALTK